MTSRMSIGWSTLRANRRGFHFKVDFDVDRVLPAPYKMVYCNAIKCTSSSSGKKSVSGILYHKLPPLADIERRKRWILNLKRENLLPDDKIRICSLHFKLEQYDVDKEVGHERNIKAIYLFLWLKLIQMYYKFPRKWLVIQELLFIHLCMS